MLKFFSSLNFSLFNFSDYIDSKNCNNSISINKIKEIFYKLNEVLKIIHLKNIVHRVLKHQIILIKFDEEENAIPKFCDLG